VISTLDKIGNVWRRSTIPVTRWSGSSTLALLAFILSIVFK
jgi:hypothetical protein